MKQAEYQALVAEVKRLKVKIIRLSAGQPLPEVSATKTATSRNTNGDLRTIARLIYKERRVRDDIFGKGLFGEPAWDMLLDLYAHHESTCCVSSACIASGSPLTTGLRYIESLVRAGFVERIPDIYDRRRNYVRLTPHCIELMDRVVGKIGNGFVHSLG